MLKLTNPEATLTYTAGVPEHQPVYVDARKVFAVVVGNFGCTTILSTDNAYICVKESAEDVARMVDEAKGQRSAPLKPAVPMSLYDAAKELVDGAWQYDGKDGRGPTDCVYADDLLNLRSAVYPDGEPE